LSVVLVPILSRAVGRPPAPTDWLGAGAGLAGLAMLTLQRIEWPSVGEALVFGCALCFAIHIVLLDRRARTVPPVVLTTGQMAVAAVACAAFVPFEVRPSSVPGEIGAAIAALAVFGSAGAFLAQSWAQKFTTPAHVGLLFTAEPVAAAALAHAWLGEVLTARQAWGAVLILGGIAVVVAAPGLRVARRVKMEE
jgi:drug/metabolite transporter (DMT)-like permease